VQGFAVERAVTGQSPDVRSLASSVAVSQLSVRLKLASFYVLDHLSSGHAGNGDHVLHSTNRTAVQ
jgi:hypothetical protein